MIVVWICIIALLSIFFQGVCAHPVVYKDATAFMTWNQSFLSDYWITYSFRPDMSVTARAMRMKMDHGDDFNIYMPQFDYLLKRWYGDNYQANIYIYGGIGGAKFQARNGTCGLAGFEADAESRKYFGLIKYEGILSSLDKNLHQIETRLGIAPYEAEYTEIASWIMIVGKYHPNLTRNYSVTPLLRLFYKTVMLETGVSLRGDWMLNFMLHF